MAKNTGVLLKVVYRKRDDEAGLSYLLPIDTYRSEKEARLETLRRLVDDGYRVVKITKVKRGEEDKA